MSRPSDAQAPEPSDAQARELLAEGELEVLGRMPWSSNATFLARIEHRGLEGLAIYKPRRGERPLWDFPSGTLCQREVAACLVSEALGWEIVPHTLLRDGPLGEGMVQRFIRHDPDEHFFTLRDGRPAVFSRFALFDVVINNADRKSGHCIRATDDHIWGIDHGLSFHTALKLRTVIWDYQSGAIADADLADLARLDRLLAGKGDGGFRRRLAGLLAPAELAGTKQRLRWLLTRRVFPEPLGEYPYPWPMV